MPQRSRDRRDRRGDSPSDSDSAEEMKSPAAKRSRGSVKSSISVKASRRPSSPQSSPGHSDEEKLRSRSSKQSHKSSKKSGQGHSKSPEGHRSRSSSASPSPKRKQEASKQLKENEKPSLPDAANFRSPVRSGSKKSENSLKSSEKSPKSLKSSEKSPKSLKSSEKSPKSLKSSEKSPSKSKDRASDSSHSKRDRSVSPNKADESDKRSKKSEDKSFDKKPDTSLDRDRKKGIKGGDKRSKDRRQSKDRDGSRERNRSRNDPDRDRSRGGNNRDQDRRRSGRSPDRRRDGNDDRSRNRERNGRDTSGSERKERDNKQNSDEARGQKRKAEEAEDEKKGPEAPADPEADKAFIEKKQKASTIMTRTGGAYIPPARLRMMQESITDKSGAEFQRMSFLALKKSINGLVNKVNTSNIINIVKELFQENIVRGRGLLCKSILLAQSASPTFTHVYASLVAIINTKFPQIGELLLKRLGLQFKKGYRRNDKAMCLSSVTFIAHLVNQQVAHEILCLEILTLLLENPTEDSVEVAIGFLKEAGLKLTEVSPTGIRAIFERLRQVSYDPDLDMRVQQMIEVMFATWKEGFKDHPSVIKDLDLVEEDDQFTHMLTLEDAVSSEDLLNVYSFDANFEANEDKYKVLKKEILDEDSGDESDDGETGSDSGDDEEDSDAECDEEAQIAKQVIIDRTETNLVSLRRIIYLTIQSSMDFEECVHKLLKTDVKPGQEVEVCKMVLDSCAQQRTYEKFFGLVAQRLCLLKREFLEPFQSFFTEQFETCHRLESNKLRNVAKFFAHLLHSDAISWEVLQCVKLNEDDTTSSSRIFVKILFQELCEFMGLNRLNGRLKDETLQVFFEGIFPQDNPKNTRFAINFFTSIGLGGLTDELRAHLKDRTKLLQQQKQQELEAAANKSSSSSSSSSSSDSSSSSSDSSSDSDSSSSSDEDKKKKKKIKVAAKEKKQLKKKEAALKKAKRSDGKGRDKEDTSKKSSATVRGRDEPRKLTSIEERMKKLAMPDVIPVETMQHPDTKEKSKKEKDKRSDGKGRDREEKEKSKKEKEEKSKKKKRREHRDSSRDGEEMTHKQLKSPKREHVSPESRHRAVSPEQRRRREASPSKQRKRYDSSPEETNKRRTKSPDRKNKRTASQEKKTGKVLSSRAVGMKEEIRELEKKLQDKKDKRRNLDSSKGKVVVKQEEETRKISISTAKPRYSPPRSPPQKPGRSAEKKPNDSHKKSRYDSSDEESDSQNSHQVKNTRIKRENSNEREYNNRKLDNRDASKERKGNERHRLTSESEYEKERSRADKKTRRSEPVANDKNKNGARHDSGSDSSPDRRAPPPNRRAPPPNRQAPPPDRRAPPRARHDSGSDSSPDRRAPPPNRQAPARKNVSKAKKESANKSAGLSLTKYSDSGSGSESDSSQSPRKRSPLRQRPSSGDRGASPLRQRPSSGDRGASPPRRSKQKPASKERSMSPTRRAKQRPSSNDRRRSSPVRQDRDRRERSPDRRRR